MKPSKPYTPLALTILVFMGMATPWVLFGGIGAIESMFNAPVRWISDDFQALQQFHAFTDEFNVHESILISWPGCTVDDPRLHGLAEAIERAQQKRRRAGEPALIHSVATGYDLLRELTSGAEPFSRSNALSRLRGVLVGPDGRTSAAAIALTPIGAKQREESLSLILAAADEVVRLPRADYRLAGPPVDGIAIDQQSIRSLQDFALPSALLSFLVAWVCLRSLWFTLPLVAVAAFGQGVALAAVYYLDRSMNAVLIVLPPLIFVLAISAGIHLVHYYYEEIRSGNTKDAPTAALRKGWLPTGLAAVTTALGLASLSISEVEPVRQFGGLGAAGILLATALLLGLLPAAMAWWPPQRRRVSDAVASAQPSPAQGGFQFWGWLARSVQRTHRWILVVTVVAFGFFGYGLRYVTTTLNVVSLLDDDTKVVQDYRWFQENLGALVTVEVVLSVDQNAELDLLDEVELVWQMHGAMREVDQVGGVISPATFLPPPPQAGGIRAIARRMAYQTRLDEQLADLQDAGYLRVSNGGRLWRISGQVQGSRDTDYGRFLSRLRSQLDPALDELLNAEGISVRYTGVMPVVYEVQRALLADLFSSFVVAMVLVGCVMVLVLRSFTAGLVAMIPNVFPTVVLFGSMGWLGWSVDIGSVMTASVALGIAVDGTFHYLGSYLRHLRAGHSVTVATQRTYQHCGRALLQTALICAAGMLVFANSRFLPARSFSWMLLLLLLIALIADLLVLPGLLLGPAGRLFKTTRFKGFLRS